MDVRAALFSTGVVEACWIRLRTFLTSESNATRNINFSMTQSREPFWILPIWPYGMVATAPRG
jgi:hypothetical protein